MKRLLLLSVIIIASTLQAIAYKQLSIDINVNGQKRNMVVFVPNSLPERSPLFIVTHGMNQDPEYQYGADKMYELIDTAKFVITYLRGNNKTWDTGGTGDLDFVSKTIDEMVTRYSIDTNRVYWSGFSMGSALIYHGMASMQDKIAAFAPTSGVAFGGKEWQRCTKPVNVIHCHAYGDDVFKYEEWNIRDYVKSLALELDQCKTYKMTKNYRTLGGNTGDREIWSNGKNGTMVELFSYNANWHNPSSGNSKEIWNFCKRFSLDQPSAKINQPVGETLYLCMAPKGQAEFPDINITATAQVAKGTIAKVELFDGNTLIKTFTEAPYQATLTNPSADKHNLRVVVTDSEGRTGEGTCVVNDATVAVGAYNIFQNIKNEGAIPPFWITSNGTTKRITGNTVLTSGNRILRFTNATRAFEYGLLVQNATTKAKSAWAKFGDKTPRSYMKLHAGQYALKFRLCNYNCPKFAPVTIAIENLKGEEVASYVYTPTVNIGNNTGNKFSNVPLETFNFDINETDDYVVVFYADAAKNSDFVLANANIQAKKYFTTGIEELKNSKIEELKSEDEWYTINGVKLSGKPTRKGLYIFNGTQTVIK